MEYLPTLGKLGLILQWESKLKSKLLKMKMLERTLI